MPRWIKGMIGLKLMAGLLVVAWGLLYADPKDQNMYSGVGSVLMLCSGLALKFLKEE